MSDEIARLKGIIQMKDQELLLYKQELLKFSHQLDNVMIQISGDVELLKKVQKVLTPTEIPNIPGFEFSRKFVYGSRYGGDYFDIFEHEDKLKFGVLLSTSSGYAMSALFLSLVLKVSHLMEAKRGLAPEKVLEQIGTELKSTATTADETHCFYGVIDRRDLTLNFCAVGRIKGFLQIPGRPLQMISSDSEALGSMTSPDFTSARVELEPKSRVVLLSNGILEVLSTDQISQCLLTLGNSSEVHDVRNEILLKCQLVSGADIPLRDQTVVVIEVKDRVIKLAK
ncbi:sigmaB regulation protein RsbU [Bdellovibrio sp. qaytius]|nr:sigmaB regulation protein RsbU [Bdellovibrio sp. qaytius]